MSTENNPKAVISLPPSIISELIKPMEAEMRKQALNAVADIVAKKITAKMYKEAAKKISVFIDKRAKELTIEYTHDGWNHRETFKQDIQSVINREVGSAIQSLTNEVTRRIADGTDDDSRVIQIIDATCRSRIRDIFLEERKKAITELEREADEIKRSIDSKLLERIAALNLSK